MCFFVTNRKNIKFQVKKCRATLVLDLMVKETFYDNLYTIYVVYRVSQSTELSTCENVSKIKNKTCRELELKYSRNIRHVLRQFQIAVLAQKHSVPFVPRSRFPLVPVTAINHN